MQHTKFPGWKTKYDNMRNGLTIVRLYTFWYTRSYRIVYQFYLINETLFGTTRNQQSRSYLSQRTLPGRLNP